MHTVIFFHPSGPQVRDRSRPQRYAMFFITPCIVRAKRTSSSYIAPPSESAIPHAHARALLPAMISYIVHGQDDKQLGVAFKQLLSKRVSLRGKISRIAGGCCVSHVCEFLAFLDRNGLQVTRGHRTVKHQVTTMQLDLSSCFSPLLVLLPC